MSTIISIAGITAAIWLALIPVLILAEIKRQGAARNADALKIITLLVNLQAGTAPASGAGGGVHKDRRGAVKDDTTNQSGLHIGRL